MERTASGRISVGVAGWSYPDWAGWVYPARKPKDFSQLGYLARFVDAMEINTSFYRPPGPAMTRRWVEQVAEAKPEFLFTAKLWQRFTHERETPWTDGEVSAFKSGMAPLREAGRLGALLMQFPSSFKADEKSYEWIARLGEAFGEFPAVVEVRHDSWNTEEALDLLRRHNLNFCNIDQPRLGRNLRPTNHLTGPVAYYRLHGRNAKAWFDPDAGRDERYNYLYGEGELANWSREALETARRAQHLFVITNNHYRGQEVVNALQLKAQISGSKVAIPEPLLAHYPVLKSIAVPARAQKEIWAGGNGGELKTDN